MNRGAHNPSEPCSAANTIPREAIEVQLGKILEHRRFADSERLKSLLAFVVTQYLQGSAASLKEIVIGAEVFGRPAGYDPKSDSIVRTSAQRLRKELKAYYDAEGADDPIVIDLPKGHYVPRFTARQLSTPQDHSAQPRWRWVLVFSSLSIVALVIAFFLFFRHRDVVIATSPHPPKVGRLLAQATSEGKTPLRVNVGHEIGWLLATPDSRQLYAVELYGRTVTVLGVEDLRITRRIQLPHPARGAVISRDGRRLYIGSPHNAVMIVEMQRGHVERVIETEGPVFDVAVTPDEQKLFLAMGPEGLKRILLNSGEAMSLSKFVCPLFLAMDAQGKRLFVSYQCDGPGGRAGHNPVESYDINSEQRLGAVTGLPMVGGPPVVAPQGDLVLLDGLDACVTKVYDHFGCPEAPSRVYHLLRTSDLSVVKSFSRPVNTRGAAFSPDGSHLVFGGDSFVAMDTARRWVTEELPYDRGGFNQFAFTPNGRRVFVSSEQGGTDVLAFDVEEQGCRSSPPGIVNQYSGDGTLSDSNGDYPLMAAGTVRFVPGLIGQAFQFKGVGTVLKTNLGGACWSCSSDWTESLFTKFDSIDGEMTLLEREGPSGRWAHRFFKGKDNRIVLEVGGVSDRRLISGSTPALPNRWYHVALVADGTRRAFYIDGVLQGQINLGQPNDTVRGRGRVFLGASRSGRMVLNGPHGRNHLVMNDPSLQTK